MQNVRYYDILLGLGAMRTAFLSAVPVLGFALLAAAVLTALGAAFSDAATSSFLELCALGLTSNGAVADEVFAATGFAAWSPVFGAALAADASGLLAACGALRTT